MKYLVKIEETLAKHVIVEAESLDEAVTIAEDAYINGNIQLDYDDFAIQMSHMQGKHLRKIRSIMRR